MRDWHKAQVKAAIEMAGTSLSEIARKNGLHPSAVQHAVKVRPGGPLLRIKRIIAATIGRSPHEVWPSLFDRDDSARRAAQQRKAA